MMLWPDLHVLLTYLLTIVIYHDWSTYLHRHKYFTLMRQRWPVRSVYSTGVYVEKHLWILSHYLFKKQINHVLCLRIVDWWPLMEERRMIFFGEWKQINFQIREELSTCFYHVYTSYISEKVFWAGSTLKNLIPEVDIRGNVQATSSHRNPLLI